MAMSVDVGSEKIFSRAIPKLSSLRKPAILFFQCVPNLIGPSKGACRGQGCCSHLWNAGESRLCYPVPRNVERWDFRWERKDRGIKFKYIGIFALRGIYFHSLIA